MNTLLVVNEEALRVLLSGLLRERGYRVTACRTAGEGWAAFTQQASEQRAFEMALVEWEAVQREPAESESARTLCSQMRSAADALLLIVLTSETEPKALEDILAIGTDDYWIKPLDPARIRLRLSVAKRQVRSLSQRRQAQEALRASVERFELAVRGTNDGIFDGTVIEGDWLAPENPFWFSPRFKSLIGFSDDEFPNEIGAWSDRLHPDDAPRVFDALRQHMLKRVPYDVEYRLKMKSGEWRWFSARGLGQWDTSGKPIRLAGAIRDVTDRVRTQEALRESELKWRSLVENSPDIILAVDPDLRISFINHTSSQPIENVIGTLATDWVIEKERESFTALLTRAFADGQVVQYEIEGAGANGSVRWYSSRLSPIQTDGHIGALIIVATDITERKRLNEELLRKQGLLRDLIDVHERGRQLSAYELHDGLIQLITASLMHLEAFAARPNLSREKAAAELGHVTKLLRDAVAEARRLLSGLRPPILDESGVVAAIEYLVNESRREMHSVTFEHEVHFNRLAPPLESALFRIVQEALTNARRHSHARHVKISLVDHEGRLKLKIEDDGAGFDRAKVPNTSFGLRGIFERARLLDGHAEIDSSPGAGTQIQVEFPLPPEFEE